MLYLQSIFYQSFEHLRSKLEPLLSYTQFQVKAIYIEAEGKPRNLRYVFIGAFVNMFNHFLNLITTFWKTLFIGFRFYNFSDLNRI